jgi:hypothetical protein
LKHLTSKIMGVWIAVLCAGIIAQHNLWYLR